MEVEPTHAKAFLRAGTACFHLKQLEKAVQHLKRALELNPKDGTTRKWLEKAEEAQRAEASSKPSRTEAATTAAVKPMTEVAPPAAPKFRREWYQTATHVTVTIFVKGLGPDDVKIEMSDEVLDVFISTTPGTPVIQEEMELENIHLFAKIIPEDRKSVV